MKQRESSHASQQQLDTQSTAQLPMDQGKVGMIFAICADWTKMRMLVGHGVS